MKALFGIVTLATACTSIGDLAPPPGPDAAPATLGELVAAQPRLAIAPGSSVRVRGRWGAEAEASPVTLPATGWLRPGLMGDRIALVDLVVETGDVALVLGEVELRLCDLSLTLDRPVAVEAMPRGLSLTLDWSLVVDGETVVPLAPQALAPMLAEGRLWLEDGRLAARLTGRVPGVAWSWLGMAELVDLEIDLRAGARAPD